MAGVAAGAITTSISTSTTTSTGIPTFRAAIEIPTSRVATESMLKGETRLGSTIPSTAAAHLIATEARPTSSAEPLGVIVRAEMREAIVRPPERRIEEAIAAALRPARRIGAAIAVVHRQGRRIAEAIVADLHPQEQWTGVRVAQAVAIE